MIHPTIHLNGSNRASLVEDWNDAYFALQKALAVLQYSAPNGRDYYPQGSEAIRIAEIEHQLRLMKIQSVMEDLNALRERAMFPTEVS